MLCLCVCTCVSVYTSVYVCMSGYLSLSVCVYGVCVHLSVIMFLAVVCPWCICIFEYVCVCVYVRTCLYMHLLYTCVCGVYVVSVHLYISMSVHVCVAEDGPQGHHTF